MGASRLSKSQSINKEGEDKWARRPDILQPSYHIIICMAT